MQMRGFFVSRLCRKLAFVNRRGAKKPKANEVWIWKALGKDHHRGSRRMKWADSPEVWVRSPFEEDNAKHWQSRGFLVRITLGKTFRAKWERQS
jgi:hypothetical protein